MKRNKRVDDARSTTAPATESWAQTATDLIVPLAQSAVAAAAPLAQTAAAKAGPLAQSAVALAVPLAQNAAAKAGPLAGQAVGIATPYAQQAVSFASPYAQQAVSFASPYAQQAAGAVTPYAQAVADKVTPYAELAAERWAPLAASGALAAHEAVDKIGPAVDAARDRVSDELLPKISTAFTAAAASPLAVEAVKRGKATVAAARGDLALPEPEPKSGSLVKRVAVVAAVAAIVALVVRKLLGGKQDSGWQAARPSAPYVPPTTRAAADAAPVSDSPAADKVSPEPSTGGFGAAGDDQQGGTSAHAGYEMANGAAEPDQPAEGGDDPALVEESGHEAAHAVTDLGSGYGEGSYVGSEPPEGFAIKGNENSKKYHLPEGRGYDQTVAEVWFSSEEAAERAGFVRAKG